MRPVAVILLLVGLAVGCGELPNSRLSGDAAAVAPTEPGPALLTPTVALTDAMARSERELDRIRHEVPRGQEMKTALGEYAAQIAELRAATTRLSSTLSGLDQDEALVQAAAPVVRDLLSHARGVATAAGAEAEAYGRLADIDIAMDAAVARWSAPTPPAELRDTLRRTAEQADELSAVGGTVPPMPATCTTMRDSRARWGVRVGDTTEQLVDLATPDQAAAFAALVQRARAAPYGQDRLAADAADRPCWLEHSGVADAEEQASEGVAQLRRLFAGP